MRRFVLIFGALVAVMLLAGCAADRSTATATVTGCERYAYHAIEARARVTGLPAACAGLTRADLSQAAGTAIRAASGRGTKSARRKQDGAAYPWVSELFTAPAPAGQPASSAAAGGTGFSGGAGGSRLGGVSEFAVQLAALIAWLATAASGGFLLLRWLLAGGSLRARTETSAPPAVMVGHFGFGLTGLAAWAVFMATGWPALAWASVVVLAPVAGLGMGVLALGLPSPQRAERDDREETPVRSGETGAGAATATLVAPPAAAVRRGRPRMPVLMIAAHGLFAATVLLLVITATVGAG